MRKSEDSGSGRILALFIMGVMILSAFGFGLGTEEEPRAAESAQLEDTEVIENAQAAPVTEGSTRAVSNMVVLNQATNEMPELFVGKLDYSFNLTLESVFEDDEDDRNGDNVLYDVVAKAMNGTAGYVQYFDPMADAEDFPGVDEYGEYVDPPAKVLRWDNNIVDMTDHGDRDHFSLWDNGDSGNAWKYVINGSNEFLDQDNDFVVDSEGPTQVEEYWAIADGEKEFDGFQFDVDPNAAPGHYKVMFNVTYRYQTFQNVSIEGVGNGTTQTIPTTLDFLTGPDMSVTDKTTGANENIALGDFTPYYWVPDYTNSTKMNFTQEWWDDTNFDGPPGNWTFRKVQNYQQSVTNGAIKGDSYYFAIPDNATGDPSRAWNASGYEWDAWEYGLANIDRRNAAWILNDYTAYVLNGWPGFSADQYPYWDGQKGNGTWEYTGNTSETIGQTGDDQVDWEVDVATPPTWAPRPTGPRTSTTTVSNWTCASSPWTTTTSPAPPSRSGSSP